MSSERSQAWWSKRCGKVLSPEGGRGQMGLDGLRPKLITAPLIQGVECPQQGEPSATDQSLDLGFAKGTVTLGLSLHSLGLMFYVSFE